MLFSLLNVLPYKLFTYLLEIMFSLICSSFLSNLDINYLLVYCRHCKYHVSNHSSKTVSMVIIEQNTCDIIQIIKKFALCAFYLIGMK